MVNSESNSRVAVPEQRGPVAAAEVVILVAVEIPHSAPFSTRKIQRMSKCAIQPRGGRHAAGQRVASALVMVGDAGHGVVERGKCGD